ncbi:MAG: S41 family peptidase [bacterium]|jgi:carboxyl-terminal processing protease
MRRMKKTLAVLLLLFIAGASAAAEFAALTALPATGIWRTVMQADPLQAAGCLAEFLLRRSAQALGDPYTMYMDSEEYATFLTETLGTYGGIGVVIQEDGTNTLIAAVYPDSPAARAGIRPGDVIMTIDGQDAVGSFATAADLLQGETGTPVVLGLERNGVVIGPLVLGREIIRINPVEARIIGGDIGYVSIASFNEHAQVNFVRELNEFQAGGVKGIILDLRGNPGGLLGQGVAVADALLPAGPIVHILSRNGQRETLRAEGEGLALPLVILVDGRTASTAEIVAGAVQDSGAGLLVGTRTFGKGTIQTLYGLGDGGLRVTVASYLTPDGRRIEREGIKPDRFVPAGSGESGDRQLAAGIAAIEALLN